MDGPGSASPGEPAVDRPLHDRGPATFPFTRHTLARDHPTTRRLECPDGSGLRVNFLGTSSMLIRDDTTSLMIVGFVSRPPLRRVLLRKVSPDRGKVTGALRRLGVERLDAVFCAHSHMDHALDAPLVAELTGAQLVGSGRGPRLPAHPRCAIDPGQRQHQLRPGQARRLQLIDGLADHAWVTHSPTGTTAVMGWNARTAGPAEDPG